MCFEGAQTVKQHSSGILAVRKLEWLYIFLGKILVLVQKHPKQKQKTSIRTSQSKGRKRRSRRKDPIMIHQIRCLGRDSVFFFIPFFQHPGWQWTIHLFRPINTVHDHHSFTCRVEFLKSSKKHSSPNALGQYKSQVGRHLRGMGYKFIVFFSLPRCIVYSQLLLPSQCSFIVRLLCCIDHHV